MARIKTIVLEPGSGEALFVTQKTAITTAVENECDVEFDHNGRKYRVTWRKIIDLCASTDVEIPGFPGTFS